MADGLIALVFALPASRMTSPQAVGITDPLPAIGAVVAKERYVPLSRHLGPVNAAQYTNDWIGEAAPRRQITR